MKPAVDILLLAFVVWVISQSIKFIVRMVRGEPVSGDSLAWIYQWGGGAPSTHAAILTAVTYRTGQIEGWGMVSGAVAVVSLILLYNLAADRKKAEIFEAQLGQSGLEAMKGDGRLLDISGHTVFELVSGAVAGIVISIFWQRIV